MQTPAPILRNRSCGRGFIENGLFPLVLFPPVRFCSDKFCISIPRVKNNGRFFVVEIHDDCQNDDGLSALRTSESFEEVMAITGAPQEDGVVGSAVAWDNVAQLVQSKYE